MRIAFAALAAACLALSACGGGDDDGGGSGPGDGPQEEAVADAPIPAEGEHTHADGLVVSLGDVSDYPGGLKVEVVASNPTDRVITTGQLWVLIRAGDTGTQINESYHPDSVGLDAVLQPGAQVSGVAYFDDVSLDNEHIAVTVQWFDVDREPATFVAVD